MVFYLSHASTSTVLYMGDIYDTFKLISPDVRGAESKRSFQGKNFSLKIPLKNEIGFSVY